MINQIGAVLGYSQLVWDKSPIEATKINDKKSDALLFGLQVGMDYKIQNTKQLETIYAITNV